jgi:hypothetical protein
MSQTKNPMKHFVLQAKTTLSKYLPPKIEYTDRVEFRKVTINGELRGAIE